MNKDGTPFMSKILQEMRYTPQVGSGLLFRGSSARISGAFPLPSECMTSSTPSVLGPKDPLKRLFDDTALNENDYLIKRKRRSLEESGGSNSTDSSVAASPWEVRLLRSELLEAKTEISTLESSIAKLHGLLEENRIIFEQKKSSLQQTIDKNISTIIKLEGKIKGSHMKEEKFKEETESALKKLTKERDTLKAKNITLVEEILGLKQKLSETERNADEARREANALGVELEGIKTEAEAARGEVASLNAALTPLKRAARQAEVDKAALIAAQMKLIEIESELKNQAETAALVKTQQNKLMRYSELERQMVVLTQEHSKLRQSTSNSLYLEEVVEDLKVKLECLAEREKELKTLRVDLGVAQGRTKEWEGMASLILPSGHLSLPSTLSAHIQKLHADHLIKVQEVLTLKSKLKSLEESHQRLQKKFESLYGDCEKLKNELEVSNNNVRRLKKQNTLIIWERNDLRSLIDSCQKEISVSGGGLLIDPRIEALEKLVQGYRERIDTIEKEAEADFSKRSKVDEGQIHNLIEEKNILEEEVAFQKAKIEELKDELELRNLKGDFNLKDTKILRLRVNPTSEALSKRQDELAFCQEELARLRERITIMKEAGVGEEALANLTQAVEERITQASAKQVEELQERVKSQEVQNQRLREVFKAKVNEFREAINCLLGYKVDSLPKGLYRLSSLYSESPDDHLLFKMSASEQLELLETEYSTTLSELIDLHLTQHHSIPMFLSALTIELFQRQTATF